MLKQFLEEKLLMQTFTILMHMESTGGARNFCWGAQVVALIYLSRQPPNAHIHMLFYYIHIFI